MQSFQKRVHQVLLDTIFALQNKLSFLQVEKLWSQLGLAGWFPIILTEELLQDLDLPGKIQSTSELESLTKIIADKSKLFFSIMELKISKLSK